MQTDWKHGIAQLQELRDKLVRSSKLETSNNLRSNSSKLNNLRSNSCKLNNLRSNSSKLDLKNHKK